MEDLKAEVLEYIMIEEFLIDLKKEFEGVNKMLKTAELKKIEQGSRTTEKFVQKLRRVAKDSRYECQAWFTPGWKSAEWTRR